MFRIKNFLKRDFLKIQMILLLFVSSFLILKPENHLFVYQETKKDVASFNTNNFNLPNNFKLDLTAHDPIYISSDADFETFGFPGLGTKSDPYIIENYNISAPKINENHNTGIGIEVEQTTKHFVVRNCYIEAYFSAIYIFNITYNSSRIENNFLMGISDDSQGLIVENSIVKGNTLKNFSKTGIRCYDSIVKQNSIENCEIGIIAMFSEISENTISNSHIGVIIEKNATIEENVIVDNVVGITDVYNPEVIFEKNATIEEKVIVDNLVGVTEISSVNNTTLINNTFDGNLKTLFFDEIKKIDIIKNVFKNSIDSSYLGSAQFSSISYNLFDSCDFKISCGNNIAFKNNTLRNSNIRFTFCSNCSLTANYFTNGGLEIEENKFESYASYTLESNLVNGKEIGLILNQSSFLLDGENYGQLIVVNCTSATIQNLEISNTINCLFIKFCDELLIQNNDFKNSITGIKIEGSDYLTIQNNILDNCIYGITFNCIFLDNYDFSYFFDYFLFSSNNYKVHSLTVRANSFFDCGFKFNPFYYVRISESDQIIYNEIPISLCDNEVNGKKLGYFHDISDLVIKEEKYGQIFLINCKDVSIKQQDLSHTTTGIEVINSTSIKIIDCTCSYNKEYGIFLSRRSDNSKIIRNKCDDNSLIGILIVDAKYVLITKNQCNRNKNGIATYLSSANNTITYNLVKDNLDYGINLGCDVLIRAGASFNNVVHHNTLINNSGPANPLYDSSTEGYQAFSSSHNMWFNVHTKKGNFWSDYNGTGNYTHFAGYGDIDLYPLKRPTWPLYYPEIYSLFSIVLVIPLGLLVYKLIFIKKKAI
ncbi:MAG: NosD domain-containing protein [Candidatus Heimdallarchaeaceae archaeon]